MTAIMWNSGYWTRLKTRGPKEDLAELSSYNSFIYDLITERSKGSMSQAVL